MARIDQIQKDMIAAMARNTDMIKKQVMFEVIQVAATCETYDEFRKTLYGMALQYLREFEDMGIIPKGTADVQQEKTETTGETMFKKKKSKEVNENGKR